MITGLNKDHAKVFHNFNKITEIPRCSGEESQIRKFLFDWATKKEITVIEDKIGNIIFKKPASIGYENHETVLLQGHMDMVCEMEKGHNIDFCRDGISAEIEDGFIVSKKTTLGADNGIAVAMIMSIFEDETLLHPPLEALITVDEERGMTGAINLEGKFLSAKKLINLDSEDEGVCCVGCAGGQRENIFIKKTTLTDKDYYFFNISLEGLTGGHSGQDIHLGRANAIVLLARIIFDLNKSIGVKLVSFCGGSKSNAIPRDAQAILGIKQDEKDALMAEIEKWKKIILGEYGDTDPNICISITDTDSSYICDEVTKENLLTYLLLASNGVNSMSSSIPGQVESSSNIGVLSEEENGWTIISQLRSSRESKIGEMSNKNELISTLVNGEFSSADSYPAWEFEPVSILREKASDVWKKVTGKSLKFETIHAGLECGLLQDVLGKMDMISIGPNMSGVHAPGEKVSIDSTERVYKFLIELLKSL